MSSARKRAGRAGEAVSSRLLGAVNVSRKSSLNRSNSSVRSRHSSFHSQANLLDRNDVERLKTDLRNERKRNTELMRENERLRRQLKRSS